jgi:hypothetical protein
MNRLALTVVTGILYCTALPAAPVDEHVRGTILSVTPDTLTVRTSSGASVSLALNGETHRRQPEASSADVRPDRAISSRSDSSLRAKYRCFARE